MRYPAAVPLGFNPLALPAIRGFPRRSRAGGRARLPTGAARDVRSLQGYGVERSNRRAYGRREPVDGADALAGYPSRAGEIAERIRAPPARDSSTPPLAVRRADRSSRKAPDSLDRRRDQLVLWRRSYGEQSEDRGV